MSLGERCLLYKDMLHASLGQRMGLAMLRSCLDEHGSDHSPPMAIREVLGIEAWALSSQGPVF